MADTGAATFESVTDDAAVGTVTWADVANAENASNDTYATAALDLSVSHYLKFLDPGTNFSSGPIPTTATINGIEVVVERSASGGGHVRDVTVRLVIGGTVTGDNKADTGVQWPASDTNKTYGGPADLWGTTPTVAQVSAGDFGFVISAEEILNIPTTARIDTATMRIYYTTVAGAAMVAQSRRVRALRRM